MKTILTQCTQCKTEFNMKLGEYKRGIKSGWKYKFCSKLCVANHRKANGKEITERFKKWQHSEENKAHLKTFPSPWSPEDSGFRETLRRARNKKRSKTIEITIDDLKELWDKQKGICPYTGWELILPKWKIRKSPKVASLDRIDSSKGYIVGNIQYVSVMVNYAKHDFLMEDMDSFCDAIKTNWSPD
jgi:rubredoxin